MQTQSIHIVKIEGRGKNSKIYVGDFFSINPFSCGVQCLGFAKKVLSVKGLEGPVGKALELVSQLCESRERTFLNHV